MSEGRAVVERKALTWRFPWKRIDPVRTDRAVKDALDAFPGARLSGRGVLATHSPGARTYVVGFPVDMVSQNLLELEHPPVPVDGVVFGRFVLLADDEMGAGAILEVRRNRGVFSVMKLLVADVAQKLEGVEDIDVRPAPPPELTFATWADVEKHAATRWTVEDKDEDSFQADIEVEGNLRQAVEVVSFEAWSEPWVVFWSTVCDVDDVSAVEVMERNADLTFAMLARDGDVYRVCWSCPINVLTKLRFDELLFRVASEAAALRVELAEAG